jgi:hypothetical protein
LKKGDNNIQTELINGDKLDFYNEIPSIKEFKAYDGIEPTTYFKGGETEGIKKMNNYF